MAREFAARGYDLALSARRLDRMTERKSEMLQQYPETTIELNSLDVNDLDTIPVVFGEFKQRFGRLDKVIVNAGVGQGATLGTGRTPKNVSIIQTNLTAALAQAEAALEIFRKADYGHLVLIRRRAQ